MTEQNQEIGKESTLDDVQKEIDRLVTKFVKIQQEEAMVLDFTGKTWLRDADFTDKQGKTTKSRMVDFELAEMLEDGTHRILSRNVQNTDVPKIIRHLKEGRMKLILSKDKQNKMSVAPVKGA